MPLRALRLVVAVVVFFGGLLIGARPIGPAPALGPFLDPAHGVWSLARASHRTGDASARVEQLAGEVTVVYDDRAVPHIFAPTEADAYRALGYVVARDRLFQLYVQTMAASGRLTEMGGRALLDQDREMRRLGLPRAAERAVAAAPYGDATMTMARAYTDGVNAYIRQMPASELPLEFRLLGLSPVPWKPIDSYHLRNRMGWTLANIAIERDRIAAAARVGLAAAQELFPDDSPIQDPIQPHTGPRFDRRPLPAPGSPDSASLVVGAALGRWLPRRLALGTDEEPGSWMASNNWAVSPKRSATGHALLAGDPHLELTLPSIWYEAHLVVPGKLDVYGVTIPGAPAIVIGFNRNVAWTFTNTGADVMDHYVERVDDDANPTRYSVDGVWRPLERRVEWYRGPKGELIASDTMYYTHRGPMQRTRGRWLSMRWTVLEGGTELAGFTKGAFARSATEFQDAIAAATQAPAQNLVAADRAGHIAIRSTGRFPIRPGDGRGSRLFDGTSSASDWTGNLPIAQYPQAADPPQGFLASANQQPMDPGSTTAWFGGSYDPWRALRLNALLRADSSVTVDDMRALQTDPGSARADFLVPYFLGAARRVAARPGTGVNLSVLRESAALLAEWDRRYTTTNQRAVLFEAAMRELIQRTWDELQTDPTGGPNTRVATPATAVLARLLHDSASAWWDDRGTPEVEDRDLIVAQSLVAALLSTRQRHGAPTGGGWAWSRIRHANIHHLLRIRDLSVLELPMQAGPSTLSPSSGNGTHGASWRMVVELGPTVRAWTTYPGGQSGHPSSAFYRNRIPGWQGGLLEPALLPATADALPDDRRSATLTLTP